ncbi:MAG TPA: ROK family protein [Abditibacterium sp.]|jgi:predicted NBD/HSP70 family sugar kinase
MLLGLEISRHDCAAVLANAKGESQWALRQNFPANAAPATQWLSAMQIARDLLHRAALEPAAISRVGVAFDALVSREGLVQTDVTRPGWENYDLKRGVREHLRVEHLGESEIVAASRVACQGLGEAHFGALRGAKNWLFLHLGDTLKSALCLDGKLQLGIGGDIGGLVIERDGALDAFGRRGTLRAYCGGDALESRARSYSIAFESPSELWPLSSANFAAQSLVEDFTSRLAQGLAGAVALAAPDVICIGGSFGRAIFEPIRAPLASKLRDLALPVALESLSLVQAALGEDAATLGALALALHTD